MEMDVSVTKCWYLNASPSTLVFLGQVALNLALGQVALNLALGLVTSCCGLLTQSRSKPFLYDGYFLFLFGFCMLLTESRFHEHW